MAWRNFEVTIADYPPAVIGAQSRSAARYDAWLRFRDCYEIKFRDFLRIVRVRGCEPPAQDGYDYVRRQYGVPVKIGQRVALQHEGPEWNGREGEVVYAGSSTAHVRVLMDGSKHPIIAHPRSIVILEGSGVTA